MAESETVHGGCVLVGEAGVLILGAAASGKSTLARELLDGAAGRGLFARLVSDDRTRLQAVSGRLVARPVAPLEGLLEARGVGLTRHAFEPAAVVRLAAVLSDEPPRLPDEGSAETTLCGVTIPRLLLKAGTPGASLVFERLCGHDAAP